MGDHHCRYQTVSAHPTSSGWVRYQACQCGLYRVHLDWEPANAESGPTYATGAACIRPNDPKVTPTVHIPEQRTPPGLEHAPVTAGFQPRWATVLILVAITLIACLAITLGGKTALVAALAVLLAADLTAPRWAYSRVSGTHRCQEVNPRPSHPRTHHAA